MTEQKPLPIGTAVKALAKCAATSAVLLAQCRVHQPKQRVGQRLRRIDPRHDDADGPPDDGAVGTGPEPADAAPAVHLGLAAGELGRLRVDVRQQHAVRLQPAAGEHLPRPDRRRELLSPAAGRRLPAR